MYIELNKWTMSCYYPFVPYFNNSIEAGIEQKSIISPLVVTTPCSVQHALITNKIVRNPYYDMNSLELEWTENKWWLFETTFILASLEKMELVFEGIDYKARVFINGTVCGISENMFIPLKIDIKPFARLGENSLKVVFEGVSDEQAQIGYSSRTYTQKCRFGYKWDFCTRLVNIGFYGKCYIHDKSDCEIEEFKWIGNGSGKSNLMLKINENVPFVGETQVTLKDQGKTIFEKLYEADENLLNYEFDVPNIYKWYPNCSGEQKLYQLTIKVSNKTDAYTLEKSVGFKDVDIIHNENYEGDALPYTLVINGVKTYIKGVNITPLDLMYSDITLDRYDKLLLILYKNNVNLIRVWGGGLIECEHFYDLCDYYGIMVWQEFIQSSSGIDNMPSENEGFLYKLSQTADFSTKCKRNHISLIAFSGGNELACNNVPVNFENKNIKMLKQIVDKNCPEIIMFPTSASGLQEFLSLDHIGQNHDVHGPWKYAGNDYHYQLFNQSDSLLHSEFGCDGMTNMGIINKFFSKKNRKVNNMQCNYIWRHHGEWWDTFDRDSQLYGKFKSLKDFIAVSQFMQAEGIRYAVEANRRRAFNNSGSIIWQANEPFPNISSTSLIDYDMNEKFSMRILGKAYQKVNPNLEYDKFIRGVGENFKTGLYVSCDGKIEKVEVEYEVFFDNKSSKKDKLFSECGDGYSKKLCDIEFVIPKCKSVLVAMTALKGGIKYTNSVLFPVKDGNYAKTSVVKSYIIKYVRNEERLQSNK